MIHLLAYADGHCMSCNAIFQFVLLQWNPERNQRSVIGAASKNAALFAALGLLQCLGLSQDLQKRRDDATTEKDKLFVETEEMCSASNMDVSACMKVHQTNTYTPGLSCH